MGKIKSVTERPVTKRKKKSKHQLIKVPLFSRQIKSSQKLQQALESWSNFSVAERGQEIHGTTFTNPNSNFDEIEQSSRQGNNRTWVR